MTQVTSERNNDCSKTLIWAFDFLHLVDQSGFLSFDSLDRDEKNPITSISRDSKKLRLREKAIVEGHY